MAQLDSFGLYAPQVAAPASPGPANGGTGSPEGVVVGSPYKIWYQTNGNILWVKETGVGTNTGWVESAGGGGGGGGSSTVGTGSPEGVETGDPGARFFATDTRTMWFKETGTGDTGWIEEFTIPTP